MTSPNNVKSYGDMFCIIKMIFFLFFMKISLMFVVFKFEEINLLSAFPICFSSGTAANYRNIKVLLKNSSKEHKWCDDDKLQCGLIHIILDAFINKLFPRGWTKKVHWAKFLNRHITKIVWMIKLSFCQNDLPMG